MTKSKTHALRSSIQALEDRAVPAAFLFDGDLRIVGGEGADTVRVSTVRLAFTPYIKVVENGQTHLFRSGQVTGRVMFSGLGGNDFFQNDTAKRTYAVGGAGNDTLYGGSADDILSGQEGGDTVGGRNGNDILADGSVDPATNRMSGGNGNDTVTGSSGTDFLYGDAGEDELRGLDGNDYLYGGTQKDYLYGGTGNDHLDAGLDASFNHLEGGTGDDTLYGGSGIDMLYGQEGADRLFGRDGGDLLNGGDDGFADYLSGGAGRDWFQVEHYGYNGNRDQPADFTLGVDEFYNA